MALSELAAYVNCHPVLRSMALRIIRRVPKVKFWLVRTIGQVPLQPTQISHESYIGNVQHPPPRARYVYKTLRMELMRNGGEQH